MATGHYARVDAVDDPEARGGRRHRLLKGRDPAKDQTYFLYGLRQDQLAHSRFPLGELTKPEVRDVARRHGLVTAEKAESQEICFVPGGRLPRCPARAGWVAADPGPLLDSDGRQVGEHAGAASYTVGQRQGLGVALGEPRYVARIDAAANLVQLVGGRTWPAMPSSCAMPASPQVVRRRATPSIVRSASATARRRHRPASSA